MQISIFSQFTNLNVRKEKAGDDSGRTGCDLSISTSQSVNRISELFADKTTMHESLSHLWNKEGAPLSGIADVKLSRELDNVIVKLIPDTISDVVIELKDCKVRKLHFKPEDGNNAEFKYQIQCHPTTEQIGQLAELIDHDLQVELTSSHDDMFGDDEPQDEQQEAA